MGRLWKHVEDPGLLQPITLPGQFGAVTCQRRWIARDIYDPLRARGANLPDSLEGTISWRIQQHRIEALSQPGCAN